MLMVTSSIYAVVTEELTEQEKEEMIKQLLLEGDQHFKQKNYNLANASYESVFLVNPNHVEASKRIDQLKKQMLKEGKSETDLVTRVYDAEIDLRVSNYLKQAKESIQKGKLAQARFTLQKLLLLNPLHEEAEKLYDDVNRKLAGGLT